MLKTVMPGALSTKDLINLTLEQKCQGVWFSGKEGDGEFKMWWWIGQLREHSFWRNSRRHGESKYWYATGYLWSFVY